MKVLAIGIGVAIAFCTGAVAADVDGSFDRTLNVSGPVDLDAVTDSGGIIVTGGSTGTVRIHAILKAHRNSRLDMADVERRIRELEQNPPIEQSGNTIRVGHVRERNFLRGISMRLEISTPRETKVRAGADSGGVRVSGVQGPVDVRTDSGGIEASDIGSDVRATADSGGIRIRGVRGLVVAHADSGGLDLVEVAGSVDAKTDSGGIRIEQSAPAPITARADSGGAHIRLASNSGYDVRAASSSGRVSVSDIVVRGNISQHRTEGKLRGGGPLVDVQVDSGNVDIQ
jgi:hypothetical protein